MAEADWTAFTTNSLGDGDVAKGVTNALTPPAHSGSNQFVNAFHSLQATIGWAGYYYNSSAFNPIAPNKGGSIRGAIRRYAAGTQYAPMLAFISSTDPAAGSAYILGLSDSEPYQIVLRKGLVGGGLDPTGADVLRVSDATWNSNSKWFHLRLDIIVNPQGDVVLNVKQNDLDTETVDDPDWIDIPGMESFTDDALGILTQFGTSPNPPITSGFRGAFGHFNNGEAGKVSLFDQLEIFRQISP